MRTTTAAPGGYESLPRLLDLMAGDEKHGPVATSTLDVIWVLFDRVLEVDPARLDDPDRDRFLLSKGHGPAGYYAVLAAKGFLGEEELGRFGDFDSALGYHPDRTLAAGVEISSGSLGHGLGLGVGTALGLRMSGRHKARVVVLVGDGELDEGSNAEAIEFAGRAHLDNLTAVALDNGSSTHGWPGGIAARFGLAGWRATDVDGHDHEAIEGAFRAAHDGVPLCVVAHVEDR
jgi:transketolase